MNIRKMITSLMVGAALVSSVPAVAGQWINDGKEKVIGGKLDTFVYLPSTQPALAGKRALMVSLHGCKQPNDALFQGGGWTDVADKYGMVVALPQAAGEGKWGAKIQCWNFHVGMEASLDKTDAKYLLDMVNELLADKALNIDPEQVYITGLSSGAAMANQMGCLAPHIFAGVGAAAGPAAGSYGTLKGLKEPAVTVEQGPQYCKTLAGDYQKHLDAQVYSAVHGSEDVRVYPAHLHRNVDIAVSTYKLEKPSETCRTEKIQGMKESQYGDLTAWCDGKGERVSKLLVNGLGHLWPAGPGTEGGEHIDHEHISYPAWVTAWFFNNNRRVKREMVVSENR